MQIKLEHKYLIFVLLVCAIVAFAFQGTRSIYDTTESRYSEAAREMLETGNWMTPQLDYHPHWTKPPMTYWMLAGSMKIFGVNEWALRLPGAVLFVGLCAVVYGVALRLWESKTAVVAAAVLASSPFVVGAANVVSTDMLLTLWTGLMMFFYLSAYRNTMGKSRLWVILMWACAGMGFLTKGPPVLLMVAVPVLFNIVMRRSGKAVPKLLRFEGLLVFGVVALWWYVAEVMRNKGLLTYWLRDEVVNRVASNEFGRHPEWYAVFTIYMPVLLFGTGVWILSWKDIFLLYKKELHSLGGVRKFVMAAEQRFLLVVWLVLPLAVFCVSKSKMPLYMLPIFPAIVLMTARGMVVCEKDLNWKRLMTIFVAAAVCCVIGKLVYAKIPSKNDAKPVAQYCLGGPGDVENIFVDHDKLSGVQFYLNGKMRRVSTDPNIITHGGMMTDVLDEIQFKPAHRYYRFICKDLPTGLNERLVEIGRDIKNAKINSYDIILTGIK